LRVKMALGALEHGDPPIWDQHTVPKHQWKTTQWQCIMSQ